METNYHLLLQLILLSWAKWIQGLPTRTLSNEILNNIFLDLDASPNAWKRQKHFYEHENAAEEPFEFVITSDLEAPISTHSIDVYSKNDLFGRISMDHDIDIDESRQTTKALEELILKDFRTTTTASSPTTTTQRPKKTGFWQSIKSIVCNDFDFSKAAEESGSPLQPISDALEDVQSSETWKNVNSYASKTKDVLVESIDDLGDKLNNWKVIDDVQHSDAWKNVNTYAGKTKEVLAEGIDDIGDTFNNWRDGLKNVLARKFNISY